MEKEKEIEFKGIKITVVDGWMHIGSVYKDGRIVVSPLFEDLDDLEKEFLITHLTLLHANRSVKNELARLTLADSLAIEEMMKRYPQKTRAFWFNIFKKLMSGTMTDLNMERLRNITQKS